MCMEGMFSTMKEVACVEYIIQTYKSFGWLVVLVFWVETLIVHLPKTHSIMGMIF